MPHIHELYDYTISAFIVHDGKVLLVNHPRYNKWLPPGGHIELDEDPEQALYREIAEETGLTVTPLTSKITIESPGTKFLLTPNYIDVHEANPPHKHIGFIYFCLATNNESQLSAEHTEMRWIAETELDDDSYGLSPSLKLYAREALQLASKTT
ncbi:hypothetical protein BH09PAT3_BH09PAT3_6900 [soil metagenome]